MAQFDITLPVWLRDVQAGIPGSVSSCGLALSAVRENEKGTLLPPGYTSIRNIEIVNAVSGTDRYPALVCLADYRGRVVRVTATSKDHLAYEVAYCNDTNSRDNLISRLRGNHSHREVTFRATTRTAREGLANLPVTAAGASEPPAADRTREVSALREIARNYARRKDVTLDEAAGHAARLINDAPGLTAEEEARITAATEAAWLRERERIGRRLVPKGNRRAPVRITGNRWL
jgi:hypothetical protein